MIEEMTLTLNSPITDEQWDAITDVDFEHTDRIWFKTKHGKEVEFLKRKKGKWVLDENPHDGDCRCSACGIAIHQMHERNHGLLNALTNGKWWTFYNFCPNCGAEMEKC